MGDGIHEKEILGDKNELFRLSYRNLAGVVS